MLDEGATLIYEGHDMARGLSVSNPKVVDQPRCYPSGNLTENGKFHKAAQEFKDAKRVPERVRVYEKILPGVWAYNGMFHLIDSWQELSGTRTVYKFKLIAVEGEEDFTRPPSFEPVTRRVIPTHVKLEVWRRDSGKCVTCGSAANLHFDHDLPFSKGGTSLTAKNVQLLCAKHNLEKHDKII